MSISKHLKWFLAAGFVVLMIFAVNTTETHAQSRYAFCNTSNILKLYSGYSSAGQAHLRQEVASLQQAINEIYEPGVYVTHNSKRFIRMPHIGAADGYFGPKTRSAVIAIQQIYGLDVDGKVGPQTRGVMCRFDAKTLSALARKQ